ncbi:MAG: GNAT family N-acetyltransferase [Terracidiphilus sp.]
MPWQACCRRKQSWNRSLWPPGASDALGRMLLHTLLTELRVAGVIEITLEVRASNHAALAFYSRAGFSQTGTRPAYYADPVEDAVLMRLELT